MNTTTRRILIVLAAVIIPIAVIAAAVLVGTQLGNDEPSAEEKASESAAAAASASSESAEAEASRSAELAQAREDRIAREQAEHDACERFAGDFLESMQQIDSRLSVGLNYDEYGDYLGDVRVVYDRLIAGINQRTKDCTGAVAIPLEKAFQKYLKVLEIWGECIDDYYCDFSEGETNRTVQTAWAEATLLINKAQRALNAMKPGR